jgi:hypothetical protein
VIIILKKNAIHNVGKKKINFAKKKLKMKKKKNKIIYSMVEYTESILYIIIIIIFFYAAARKC